jgi:hypothetical protein
LRSLSLLAASIVLCASLPAQAGEVAGTVYDSRGAPQAGVTLDMAGQQAVTGADGAFVFGNVPAGDQPLAAGAQAVIVTVPAEGTVRRNLFLLSRAARASITGSTVDAGEGHRVMANAMRLGDAMLAEADRLPRRTLRDSEG